jgi:hypothetical protein
LHKLKNKLIQTDINNIYQQINPRILSHTLTLILTNE